MQKQKPASNRPNLSADQRGIAHLAIITLCVVVVAVVAFAAWRVQDVSKQANTDKTKNPASQTAEIDLQAEDLEKKAAATAPTNDNTPAAVTTQTKPTTPINNATTGAKPTPKPASPTAQPTPTAAPAPAPASAPTPNPAPATISQPTAQFCAQKNGNSFTNIWLTGNASYTYDGYQWENGYSFSLPRVSKTETGTPVYNSDSMTIFDVLTYGTQPSWAICSEKAGYVMVYYSVPNSPYTFNVLAKFEHLSLTQP
jgi:hypothetical protein